VPIRDWFRPPRSLLTLYLAGAAVAVACLAWLAIRQLQQDAVLDAQRATDRLQGAANLAAARSLQALVDLERLVAAGEQTSLAAAPAHVHVVRVHDSGMTVLAGHLPFVPIAPATTPVPDGVFDGAEQLELTSAGRARAAAAYRSLATSSSAPVRAGASMRLARLLRQQGQHGEALNVYAGLAEVTGVVIEGRPADLIARLGRCGVLDALGRRDELTREAVSLRADLARGRWPITPALWASVFEDASRWAGAEASASAIASLDDDLAAAGALERFWQQRQGASAPGGRRMVLDTPSGLAVVIEQVHDGETRALVAGPSHVASIRQDLSDTTTTIRLLLPDARPAVQEGATTVSLRASESGLPWTLVVADADPDRARSESRSRRTTFLAGLALVGVLILASGYFTFRGIRREIAIARLQSEFVSAVSHEFRTPLTSIRQLSHMLHDGRVASDERRTQYYDVLVRESERLNRLVERMLGVGRADAGKFRFEAVDARDLARAVVTDFSGQAGARAIDVTTSSSACPLQADREMLSLALWNLLDNAVKYSPEAEPVRVDVAPRDGRVAIAVQDRGVGISLHDRQRVFDKFVRGSTGHVAETTGSGLGLALVDRVVRAHGGTIELASEPGRGSSFTIVVPMAMETVA
jgi:signal transduction histidine kinase